MTVETIPETLTPLEVSRAVLDAAYEVHSRLGPGLLESVYQTCLQHELRKSGHKAECEVGVPVNYDSICLDTGFRIDLLVDGCVVVELKAVEALAPIHKAQMISYLRLSGKTLGLLINFNVPHLKDGIKRFVRGHDWATKSVVDTSLPSC